MQHGQPVQRGQQDVHWRDVCAVVVESVVGHGTRAEAE